MFIMVLREQRSPLAILLTSKESTAYFSAGKTHLLAVFRASTNASADEENVVLVHLATGLVSVK